MAKQIWLYSCVDAGMSLSCWIWNRTPVGQVGMRPPYGPIPLVTIACVSHAVMEASGSRGGAWVQVLNGLVRLRFWLGE